MKLPTRGDFVKELRKEVQDLKQRNDETERYLERLNSKEEKYLKELKIRIERLEKKVEELTKEKER